MRKLILSLFALSLLSFNSAHASPSCQDVFSKDSQNKAFELPNTRPTHEVLEDFQHELALRQQTGKTGLKPKFRDPREEIEISKTWHGEELPGLLKSMAPEGIKAIDHSLIDANMEGVVKTANGGSFVSARANFMLNGKPVGFNFGAHAYAFVDNAFRPVKSLVREEAKAAIVFVHGGGTKTTGHHVAIQMHNFLAHFGIDVITIDLPWHAEGDRNSGSISDPLSHDLEMIREFARKYLKPSGKPLILSGHSWGGLITDEYMQRYPKSKEDIFSGLMPLSGVPDLAPGGTSVEKLMAEIEKEKLDAVDARIPQAELEMGKSLFRSNKISPVAGAYIEAAMRKINWSKPSHQGNDYLPALIVMGEKDPLYLNVAHIWEDYRIKLSNVEWHLLPQEGHLIFEAQMPGTKTYWTYTLMKDFVSKVIGQPLEKEPPGKQAGSDKPTLASFVIEWLNRPIFREFVRHSTIQIKSPTAEFHKHEENLNRLQPYLNSIKAIENRKIPQEDKDILLNNMVPLFVVNKYVTVADAKAEATRMHLIKSGNHVPQGPKGEEAKIILDELKGVNAQVKELSQKKEKFRYFLFGPAKKPSNANQAPDEILLAKYEEKVEELAELIKNASTPELEDLRRETERRLQVNIEFEGQLRMAVHRFYEEQEAQGLGDVPGFMERFPKSILNEFEANTERGAELQAWQKVVAEKEKALALSGALGPQIAELAQSLFGPGGLEERLHKDTQELVSLERQVARLLHRQQELRNLITRDYSENYFTVEETPAMSLFEVPVQEWTTKRSGFERLKANWREFWRERPPEKKMSYY